MRTHAAFIRAVNVGGQKPVKMSDLRMVLQSLGFEEVETVLQSGSVVFRSSDLRSEDLETRMTIAAEERLSMRTDFMVRTGTQIHELVKANPFPKEAIDDPSHLLVLFGKRPYEADEVALVQSKVAGPERMAVAHGHLFVFYPIGIGDSKIVRTPGWTALGANGTGRNWNTVGKVAALLR